MIIIYILIAIILAVIAFRILRAIYYKFFYDPIGKAQRIIDNRPDNPKNKK